MGWQDREYSRSRYDEGGRWSTLWRWVFGEFYLGTWARISIYVHAALIWLIALNLIGAVLRGSGLQNAIVGSVILFGIILLHEFGHCFAARSVGGDAERILMWPLGGLAYIRTPQRPWPSFVGTAGGPLVNVAICLVTGIALLLMSGGQFRLPLNPLLPFGGQLLLNDASFQVIYGSTLGYYLWWIYTTSYMLLFFNLLPIFPLDGGRLLQVILWPRLGFYNSMNIACTVGMAGSVVLGLLGLAGNFILLAIGIIGFMTCQQTRMNLPALSQQAWEDGQYSGGSEEWSVPSLKRMKKTPRRHDDNIGVKRLNPWEWWARKRRKKQFERLMRDD